MKTFRDVILEVVENYVTSMGVQDSLTAFDISAIVDEVLVQDPAIREIPDIIAEKVSVIIDAREKCIQCDNCSDMIELGDIMYQIDNNYVCSTRCVLEFTNTVETVLEKSYFEEAIDTSYTITKNIDVGTRHRISSSYGYAGIDSGVVEIAGLVHLHEISDTVDVESYGEIKDNNIWVEYLYVDGTTDEYPLHLPISIFLDHISTI